MKTRSKKRKKKKVNLGQLYKAWPFFLLMRKKNYPHADKQQEGMGREGFCINMQSNERKKGFLEVFCN